MKVKIFQKGFNYSQDGEGNRLVCHLQGCNMSCPWCANPEGMKAEGVIMEEREWLLDSICPWGAIKNNSVDRGLCCSCKEKECITRHRTKGMRLSFIEYEAENIVKEITESRAMFYGGGGVTFSGGEPTLQLEPLKLILKNVKTHGIHTAIETNGSHPGLEELFPYVDQLIIDCKQCDEEKHKKATGVSFRQVKENIMLAAKEHPCVHIRIPLIGGVNDREEDFGSFLRFFTGLQGDGVTFELLTYHEYGRSKWEQCGIPYKMDQKACVNPGKARMFKERMVNQGLHYVMT